MPHRIRLLIDVMIKDDKIHELQKHVDEQPLVTLIINDFDEKFSGRFVGAQEVEKK